MTGKIPGIPPTNITLPHSLFPCHPLSTSVAQYSIFLNNPYNLYKQSSDL